MKVDMDILKNRVNQAASDNSIPQSVRDALSKIAIVLDNIIQMVVVDADKGNY